eukprot:2327902-Prymnesium_polylepis.1
MSHEARARRCRRPWRGGCTTCGWRRAVSCSWAWRGASRSAPPTRATRASCKATATATAERTPVVARCRRAR